MKLRRRVRPAGDGGCHLNLPAGERALLRSLAPDLRQVLDRSGDPDPVTERLFPAAYPEDDEREGEFRELVGGELESSLLQALEVLEATADADHLERDEADAWLRALNQARLVLGVRLAISEDGAERPREATDPRAGAFATYDYLSLLQEELLDALGPPR